MKTLFVAAGPITWGSSRMRCYWPAKYMDADVVQYEQLDGKDISVFDPYDAVIFQKQGHPGVQEHLLSEGKQVWWDACDPMWWFSPGQVEAITEHLTGVVVSSQKLGEDFMRWGNRRAYLIDDRLELEHFQVVRQHQEAAPVRLIWYGVAVNKLTLYAAWANLERLVANGYNIELTLMSDNLSEFQPGPSVSVSQTRFSLAHENAVIASHDIALLPPYPGPWGEVKSPNKNRTAMACGLPVTQGTNYSELEYLVRSHKARQEQGERGRKDVEDLWQVERSAKLWERLLSGEEI